MTNTTIKAVVAKVQIGHLTIDGLMMPDGSFAIAAPQVANLFQFAKDHASRDMKALLGKDFQFAKTKSELHPKAVNILTLPQFEIVTLELALRGNQSAISLQRSLVGLGLYQLFCDAFGIKFEEIDRQNWLKERQEGKFYRRSLTDAVKVLIDRGHELNYGYITLQTYRACGLESDYKAYKAEHKDTGYRNTLNDAFLRRVAKFEELVADYVMVDYLDIESAMKKAARYIRV
jgi:hypothetical protein